MTSDIKRCDELRDFLDSEHLFIDNYYNKLSGITFNLFKEQYHFTDDYSNFKNYIRSIPESTANIRASDNKYFIEQIIRTVTDYHHLFTIKPDEINIKNTICGDLINFIRYLKYKNEELKFLTNNSSLV